MATMLFRLLALCMLAVAVSGKASFDLYRHTGCTKGKPYHHCSHVPANHCCHRPNRGGFLSANIYFKPKASKCAAWASVDRHGKCSGLIGTTGGNDATQLCINSHSAESVKFKGVAWYAPGKAPAAIGAKDMLSKRESECEGSVFADIAVLHGKRFNLTSMPTPMVAELDNLMDNDGGDEEVLQSFEAFQIPFDEEEEA